jgi:hypothetical protein
MNKKKLISSLGIILKNKKPVVILNNYKGMLKRMDKALEQINLSDLDEEDKNFENKKSLNYDENIIIVSVRTDQNNPSISRQMEIFV